MPASKLRGQINLCNLSVSFSSRGKDLLALQDVNVSISPGEFICLLGPSGCGKSTLLNCIAGFVSPTLGSVEVDGDLITSPGPDRGMVFQNHSLYPWKTVLKNVSFGPEITLRGASAPEATARTFLQMVGLSKYENYYPHELSGGMQQRVGIARALANYPSVLLMDEPFGALDSQTRSLMQENLLALWRDLHITVVFVTHDIDEAVLLADRILVMGSNPGHVVRSLDVSLPRPRSSDSTLLPEFLSLRKQCLDLIRVETMSTFEN